MLAASAQDRRCHSLQLYDRSHLVREWHACKSTPARLFGEEELFDFWFDDVHTRF